MVKILKYLKNYLTIQPKIYYYTKLNKHAFNKDIVVLDIGAGNNSPTYTKRFFPSCVYHAVDKYTDHFSVDDSTHIDSLYVLDLDVDTLDVLPNNYYDYIIMAHVIEHLKNGLSVLQSLIDKLKDGGVIYLEYPAFRSVFFPSMPGTLNFFDDKTHIRLYDLKSILNVLLDSKMIILRLGKRHLLRRIFLLPLYLTYNMVKKRYVPASVFWDILGFAEYVIAQKVKSN